MRFTRIMLVIALLPMLAGCAVTVRGQIPPPGPMVRVYNVRPTLEYEDRNRGWPEVVGAYHEIPGDRRSQKYHFIAGGNLVSCEVRYDGKLKYRGSGRVYFTLENYGDDGPHLLTIKSKIQNPGEPAFTETLEWIIHNYP